MPGCSASLYINSNIILDIKPFTRATAHTYIHRRYNQNKLATIGKPLKYFAIIKKKDNCIKKYHFYFYFSIII